MLSAPLPFIRDEPMLGVEEPECGPGDDRLVNSHPAMPLLRTRQVEAEARGSLLIYVRQSASLRERGRVRVVDEYLRTDAAVAVFDSDPVLATKRRRRDPVVPDQPPRMQRA